jgi:hypothetical protein
MRRNAVNRGYPTRIADDLSPIDNCMCWHGAVRSWAGGRAPWHRPGDFLAGVLSTPLERILRISVDWRTLPEYCSNSDGSFLALRQ